MQKEMSYNQSQPWPKFLRRWGSISLFLSHSSPGLPLEFLHLEQQMMSYRSVHVRGTQWVKRARSRTADLGAQFLCFWVTLGIASRSPFGIFAFGATNDELQFRARKGHTVSEARERAHSRFRGSISLFLSHSWHCLQVSLWNFCNWRSYWWATGLCT